MQFNIEVEHENSAPNLDYTSEQPKHKWTHKISAITITVGSQSAGPIEALNKLTALNMLIVRPNVATRDLGWKSYYLGLLYGVGRWHDPTL